jgi:hypothetical protein
MAWAMIIPSSIGSCFKHLSGGDGIGPQGDNFDGFFKSVLESFYDGTADSPTLAVYDTNSLHCMLTQPETEKLNY